MRNQLILDVHHELFADNFAGGGGASTGIEMALGRHVDHAINHDPFALGMHRINHPQTVHHPEDVFDVDPLAITEGRPVGGGWFSPDCKHFSKAKGGKPLSKKIRGLAFVMLRWAKIRVRVIYMENVEEIKTWGPLLQNPAHSVDCTCGEPCGKADPAERGRTWRAFLAALGPGVAADSPDLEEMLAVLNAKKEPVTRAELVRGFGYQVETRELRGCDYGAPTIRKRLFLIARCDGRPIVWPAPTHGNPALPGFKASRLKPWRAVAECIDWSVPGKSIFLTKAEAKKQRCKRPLAAASLRRVATGVDRYVLKALNPFLVSLTHQKTGTGGDRVEPVSEPAKTITCAHRGEKAVVDGKLVSTPVAPFISEHANASNQRNMPADEPMRTLCSEVKGGHFSAVAANMVKYNGDHAGKTDGAARGQPIEEPLKTQDVSNRFGLVSACLVQKGHVHSNSEMVKGADEPMRTQATRPEHGVISASLVGFYGNKEDLGQPVDEPARVIMTKEKFGMAASHMVKLRGNPDTHTVPGTPMDEPLPTASAGGQHHGMVSALMVQNNNGFNRTPHRAADAPVSTITGSGSGQSLCSANMAVFYGSEHEGQGVQTPCRTVTVRDRFALTQSWLAQVPIMTAEHVAGARRVAAFLREHGVEFAGEYASITVTDETGQAHCLVLWDLTLRMLLARELFLAQSFPPDYVIDRAWLIDPATGEIQEVKLTQAQQIRMCGNSVCPVLAQALVAANSPDMAINARDFHRSKQRKQRPLSGVTV